MVVEISSLDIEGLQVFSKLTEAQLRNRLDPEQGIFIVERDVVKASSCIGVKEEARNIAVPVFTEFLDEKNLPTFAGV